MRGSIGFGFWLLGLSGTVAASTTPPRHVVMISLQPPPRTPVDADVDPTVGVAAALNAQFAADALGSPAPRRAVLVSSMSSIAVPQWMRAPIMPTPTSSSGRCDDVYRPSGLLAAKAERRREAYYAMMSSIACEHGLPVGLFDALIIQESGYDPAIWSPKLAYGLTQLMPGTARLLGVDRFDIAQNLRGGARYLRGQLDRFGAWHLALAAYNAGPGRVSFGRVPRITETQTYVASVLSNWSRLTASPQVTSLAPIVPSDHVLPPAVRFIRF